MVGRSAALATSLVALAVLLSGAAAFALPSALAYGAELPTEEVTSAPAQGAVLEVPIEVQVAPEKLEVGKAEWTTIEVIISNPSDLDAKVNVTLHAIHYPFTIDSNGQFVFDTAETVTVWSQSNLIVKAGSTLTLQIPYLFAETGYYVFYAEVSAAELMPS